MMVVPLVQTVTAELRFEVITKNFGSTVGGRLSRTLELGLSRTFWRRSACRRQNDATMTAAKRIVLTGASGYVGQHVLSRLMQESSLEIYAVCRDINGFSAPAMAAALSCGYATVIVTALDLTDAEAIDKWISSHPDLDICLHLAATSNPRACEETPELAMACNNPVHWFQALSSNNVPIVALSTDQVYGGTKGSLYVETDATNPVNVYGKTKVAMEESLRQSHVKCVSLRSSIVLGPLAPFGNAHSTFLHFCESRNKQETDFYTDECRTVISVDDVVNVLLYFCQHGVAESATFNMGGRDGVSRYEMAKAVFEHYNYDTQYLIAKEKALLPPGAVASPLDISMDSSKLSTLTGITFKGLGDIVRTTFPK